MNKTYNAILSPAPETLSPLAAFRPTIRIWTEEPHFFHDCPEIDEQVRTLQLIDDKGIAILQVLGDDDKLLFKKSLNKRYSSIKLYAESIHGIGIFTCIKGTRPTHEVCVTVTLSDIRLTVKTR